MGELAKWGEKNHFTLSGKLVPKKKKLSYGSKKALASFSSSLHSPGPEIWLVANDQTPLCLLKKVKQLLQSGWDGLSLIWYQQSGFAAAPVLSCLFMFCGVLQKSRRDLHFFPTVFNLCVCVCAQFGVAVLIRSSSLSTSSEGLVCGLNTG